MIGAIVHFRRNSEWKRTVRALQSLPRVRIDQALQAFTHDRHAGGNGVPTVSLGELTSHGYLRSNEVAGLSGMKVTFFLNADETRPQTVLVRVQLASGQVIELGDGSVQMVSRRTMENELARGQ